VPLVVKGFGDAVVSLPVGATTPKPIVIAAHDNYDRPEWQCEVWRSIVHDRAFVLCPRGVRRSDSPSADDIRFTYDGGDAMNREVDAGLAALRARFPEFVSAEEEDALVYTGFSLGAINGVAFALRAPKKFPRLVLTEGSQGQWSPAAVHSFATQGGLRVLFACGQPSCVTMSNNVAAVMQKKGLGVKVVHGKGVGHGYDGPVADEIRGVLEWLVEGDARFALP
jgi:pimeloyl-ACP methyl ester carboxylesterase